MGLFPGGRADAGPLTSTRPINGIGVPFLSQRGREQMATDKHSSVLTSLYPATYNSSGMHGTLTAIAVAGYERIQNRFPDVGGLHSTLRASKPAFLGRPLPVCRTALWRLALNQ
jgi:hypothetical protein